MQMLSAGFVLVCCRSSLGLVSANFLAIVDGPSLDSLFHQPRSAEWWTVGLTGVLTVAAVIAGVMGFRQLGSIDAQLAAAEKARKTSIRPVLNIQNCFVLPCSATERLVELRVRNVGLAAARNIKIKAWVFPFSSALITQGPSGIRPFATSCLPIVAATPAPLSADIEAIAAGEEGWACLLDSTDRPAIQLPPRQAIVFMTARFLDLDDSEYFYPSSPPVGKLECIWRVANPEDRLPNLP